MTGKLGKKELIMVRLEKNDPLMLARQLPIKSVALILAGGRTRLKDLTIKRETAVHFGGKFRIIDFALSNCINSGIRRIGVITQYQSHTLVQHIQRGWSFFSEEMNEFVDLLPAQQRVRRKLVSRHGGCGDAEPRHHSPLQGGVRGDPRGRPYLQTRLLAHADRPRRKRGALHRGLYAGAH
jgi:hypothetical protein